YFSVAACLREYFMDQGAPSAADLAHLEVQDCLRIFRQDPANPVALELMGLFARALNDLGQFLLEHFGGHFAALVEEAGGSADQLVACLTEMPFFNDVARWKGNRVAFFKRAQLAAADLHFAFGGEGPGRFVDIDRLTIFADNLVPHVLRRDGILRFEKELADRIDRGELIPAGSEEEVEIRACAVHAGELLVAELRRRVPGVNAMLLDNFLWHRGQQPEYRQSPRHRTRTVYY
ncbi:MAG: queuosine salvage family protein, partial [Desulfuromonadales bacterium]